MKTIIRVYKKLFQHYPKMKWKIPLRAFLSILSPLLESAIPAMAIAMILEKDVERYLLGISILLLLDVLIRCVINTLQIHFEDDTLFLRVVEYWSECLEKNITTDYCNVEPAVMQNKMQKGMNALNGDLLGVQGVLNNSFHLVVYTFGLLSYGSIVVTIDWRILLIMIVMSIVSFLLHRHAVKYSDKETKKEILRIER